MADDNKTLIASSEFDPAAFIAGIDAMTASLEKLSAQEDHIRADMNATNNTLKANRAELKQTEDQIKSLDKTSKTYADDLAKLRQQQTTLKTTNKEMTDSMKAQKVALTEINMSAVKYKESISQISAISKQVANENKGRTLFDVASLNQQVQDVVKAGANLRNVFKGKIDDKELVRLESAIAGAKDEFQQLGEIIDFIKPKLETLDPNSQEFADLTQVVETGEQVLEQYGQTVEQNEKKAVSMKTQLRLLREELAKLEDQGQENTAEFQEMAIAAGRLDDQIGDTQARIKVLGSDTRNLDFGIGAIRGVASAFGVAEGAAALFGIKNEDVMESIQRLNAIMLILNGLQEIQNLLQKQSVVAIVGQSIATKGAAIAQGVYAAAVGTATGAMRAFRIALLATGIGAFVVLLGVAVEAMSSFGDETNEAVDASIAFNEALEDGQLILDSRTRSIRLNGQIQEEQLKRGGATEKQISDARVANMQKERDALVLSKNEIRSQQDAYLAAGNSAGDFIEKSNAEATQLFGRILDIDDAILLEKEKNLTQAYDDQKKALENQEDLYRDYLGRLADLQRQLRDTILAAQPQDEQRLREGFANALADALADLDRDVSEGKLTKGRANVLKNLVRQINTVDLQEGLKEFKIANEKAETDLARSLFDLRMRAANERAELIRDQYTREAEIIANNAKTTEETLRRELADMITAINETADQGLISPEQAAINVQAVSEIYGEMLGNLIEQTERAQEQLSRSLFEITQAELQRTFASVAVGVSEQVTAEIVRVTQQFQAGAITYEQYQKQITKIAREESQQRIKVQISENEAILAGVRARLAAEQDPAQRKALEDQITQLRATITALKREEAGADAQNQQSETEGRNRRLEEIGKYATAIGNVVGQVVQFWAAANEAEQRSLDRSIALQERRVEAATRIAERGNAEYLRLEEDRLNELRIKQENAARRQLAINAVLQTSQALTAFISALAQGIATGGPLGGIAIAGAVIGLIGAGYQIINSLQKNNQQTFYKGTKSVKRKNGEPSGIDTVPALLTEGEAVIPGATNKEYSPAVAAIYDRSIPAEEMNAFVNSYRTNRRILPRLDHDRMAEVSNVVVTYDGELLAAHEKQAQKLEENNDLLKRMNQTLKSMGVSLNIDRHGLALSLMKAVQQEEISKKA